MIAVRSEPGFFAKTARLATKDIRIELRSRDTLLPMLAFSLAVVLLLAFSLPSGSDPARPARVPFGTVPLADVLAAFLWVTVLFAGLVAFARTFDVDRRDAAIDPLLLAPLDRSGLFLSKAAANLAYIVGVEVLLIPAFVLFFGVRLGAGWPALLLVVVLVNIAFVAVGTLLSVLAAQTSSRELMLPILALPMLVPVFIAAVELTSELFAGAGGASVGSSGWFGILIASDLIFAIVGMLAFDHILDG